jgi:hypothetical protein
MREFPEFNYLSSEDLDMLTEVLEATTPHPVEAEERHARAATILRLFQSGIDTKEKLLNELGGAAR